MKIWLALILSPSLVLGAQSLMYSLVTPQCAEQTRTLIHVVAAGGLLVVLVLGVLAWSDWSVRAAGSGQAPDDDRERPAGAKRFLAIVATGVAALSAVVMLAMWIGVWVLWPCGQQ